MGAARDRPRADARGRARGPATAAAPGQPRGRRAGAVYRCAQPKGNLPDLIAECRPRSILNLRGGSYRDDWYDAEVRAGRAGRDRLLRLPDERHRAALASRAADPDRPVRPLPLSAPDPLQVRVGPDRPGQRPLPADPRRPAAGAGRVAPSRSSTAISRSAGPSTSTSRSTSIAAGSTPRGSTIRPSGSATGSPGATSPSGRMRPTRWSRWRRAPEWAPRHGSPGRGRRHAAEGDPPPPVPAPRRSLFPVATDPGPVPIRLLPGTEPGNRPIRDRSLFRTGNLGCREKRVKTDRA